MIKQIAIVSLLTMLALPAVAQPDSHHPDQAQAQGTTTQGPTTGQAMVMGQGMMGPVMNCPMMGMMGAGNPHTEGRLAFLKTELKITASQEKAWKTYSDTVRAIDEKRASSAMSIMGRGTMGSGMMGQSMMQQGASASAPEALGMREKLLQAHLKALKDLQAATKKLYRELDDAQKKTADELLGMPCCVGAM